MRPLLAALALLLAAGCGDDDAGVVDAGVEIDAEPGTPPCGNIGPLGRCHGDTLAVCTAGESVETSCADDGQVCAFIDDVTGYGCADPASVEAFVVAGYVQYEDRPPLPDGALGAIELVRARGARVAVVADDDSSVLATSVTADDGSYLLRYQASAGEMVHVLATTQSILAGRPIRVMRNGQLHGFGGVSFAAAPSATSDIIVSDASGTAEAFNIHDQMVSAMDFIVAHMGTSTPVPLVANWVRGSENGTYYDGDINMLGASDDDDGYDDTVILHEIGHYVEDTLGRSDSPGGPHNGTPTNPRLAWSEGFATYFAMAVRDIPLYIDSNASGGWSSDGDREVSVAPMPTGTMTQNVREDMITEDLWDLGDRGPADDDGLVEGVHHDVVRVQVEYLRTMTLRAVGVSGVDLVDFLDGWFLAQGLTGCAAVRDVVTTLRLFPYDYAGPGGACPP